MPQKSASSYDPTSPHYYTPQPPRHAFQAAGLFGGGQQPLRIPVRIGQGGGDRVPAPEPFAGLGLTAFGAATMGRSEEHT